MRNTIYILFLLLFGTASLSAQNLTITDSTTTSSLCFNTGSIQVAASGGTGGYTFTIISGPSYPNITYPIALPSLSNTFLTLPHGQYTIKVVDGAGNIAYATATVEGNYQFPVLSPTIDLNNCIHVAVQGGRSPYQYAISSTSVSTGFGSYQSSNVFCVCTGHYWVKVLDSCGNIFTTTQINVTVPVPTITLTSHSSATRDTIRALLASGGSSPYSYQFRNGGTPIINTTGVFITPKSCNLDTVSLTDRCNNVVQSIIDPHPLTPGGSVICAIGYAQLTIDSSALGPFTITGPGITGSMTIRTFDTAVHSLPAATSYVYHFTDSCGKTATVTLTCTTVDTNFFYTKCPYDSSIYLLSNQINYCFPVIATCLNCIPVQTDTVTGFTQRIFRGLQVGTTASIKLQDNCGFLDTIPYVIHYAALTFSDNILTCNDFAITSSPLIITPTPSYYVYKDTVLIDSAHINDPTFFHEPAGSYHVVGTDALCASATVSFTLPDLGGRCIVPMFDSSCTPSYAIFQTYITSPEVFTLVNTITNQRYVEHLPPSSTSAMLFANVPVGTYNLVSDSGCSYPYVLPAYHYAVSEVTATLCTGQSRITATCTPAINSCNTAQTQFFELLKDNQLVQSNNSGSFIVSDTGNYVLRLFLSNTSIFIFPATFDTVCPLDTILFHVAVNPNPNVVSTQQFVCGHSTANVPYTIFGGEPPYTVSITGFPTRTVISAYDTFPNVYPGIYTMIVSDSCGISRSFSVSVVDTCSSNCQTVSIFSLIDTVICLHGAVYTNNQSTAATHYKWKINGLTYAYITDTFFLANNPGRDTVTLYAYVGTCVDSSKHTFLVVDTIHSTAIADTFQCLPFDLKLNTHNANSHWSTGVNDSVATITAGGKYYVNETNACGTKTDSFNVTQRQSPVFGLTSSAQYICDDQPDSATLTAALTNAASSPVAFIWSTGYNDTSAYNSQILVYKAGGYQVTVNDGFCPQKESISINSESCDSICLTEIAVPNVFSPNGDNKNDTFNILHICRIEPFRMQIYNRWGERIFESNDINMGWDGNYRGKPQPQEIYWYYLSLSIDGRRTQYRAGTLTLER